MDANPADLQPLDLFQRAEHEPVKRFRIDSDFAAEDTFGDGEGQPDKVRLGFGAQTWAQGPDFFDGTAYTLDGLLILRGCPRLAGRLALSQSGRVRIARTLLG